MLIKVKAPVSLLTAMVLTAVILTTFAVGALSARISTQSLQGENTELQSLVDCETTQDYGDLDDFQVIPRNIHKEDTACLSLRMFREMNFIRLFNISEHTLFRFILRAQKGYRNLPYHNWSHGFAVLNFSFTVLKKCQLIERQHFTPLEGLALLTAAMCHDVDHRGTDNRFQMEINSSLAQRYGEQGSIMERHHIAVTFDYLQKSDTNFLAHLNESIQNNFKNLIQKIILATDLAVHFKQVSEEKEMAVEGLDRLDERHRELLRSIIISCADLSDQSKDWATVRSSAKLVYTEFFNQGAQERKLGISPLKMMDPSQARIPELQVDFLSHVVIPDFQVLLSLYPETQPCMDNMQENCAYWKKAAPYFESQSQLGRDQLEILMDKALDTISTWPEME